MGLTCQNNTCKCNATQFWYKSTCLNYFRYNTGICTADNQCEKGLICQLNGTSCSCPIAVPIGNCDCPTRVVESEYYYNGSSCVEAASYNKACTGGNYTCKTLKENTLCDLNNGICNCGPCGYWNYTTCFYSTCPTGWTYYRGSCFWSSNKTQNLVNGPGIFWIRNVNCYGMNESRLAVLHNSDFNNSCLTTANGFSNYSWYDAYRNTDQLYTYYAIKTTGAGNNITADANWENYENIIAANQCAVWNAVTRRFKAIRCNLGNDT